MSDDPLTTICLAGLTAAASVATVLALLRFRGRHSSHTLRTAQYLLTGVCIAGTAVLFVYRALFLYSAWRPLAAHVEGLLLISTLFAAAVLFVQRAGIRGISVFALPLLTFILAWGVCASAWTYEPFSSHSMWMLVHRASVYLGCLFFLVAASAGVMYLYAQRGLNKRLGAPVDRSIASLEAIERLNIRAATLGFVLLTLGLVAGLVIMSAQHPTQLRPHWWFAPKVVLATFVWLIYALVMNVRYASSFRGARAAWLSIAGLVLLLATFSVVQSLPPLAEDGEQLVGRPRPSVAKPQTLEQAAPHATRHTSLSMGVDV